MIENRLRLSRRHSKFSAPPSHGIFFQSWGSCGTLNIILDMQTMSYNDPTLFKFPLPPPLVPDIMSDPYSSVVRGPLRMKGDPLKAIGGAFHFPSAALNDSSWDLSF